MLLTLLGDLRLLTLFAGVALVRGVATEVSLSSVELLFALAMLPVSPRTEGAAVLLLLRVLLVVYFLPLRVAPVLIVWAFCSSCFTGLQAIASFNPVENLLGLHKMTEGHRFSFRAWQILTPLDENRRRQQRSHLKSIPNRFDSHFFVSRMPTAYVPPTWGKSAARDLLYKMVKKEMIPYDMKPKAVYETYLKDLPEFIHFQDYTALQFANKLGSVRKRISQKSDRSEEDAKFLAHDRKIYPQPTEDWRGEPTWKGSPAQKALIGDIKSGEAAKWKPKVLYESRDIYWKNFPDQDRFRNRIYQETKALKRLTYLETKRAVEAEKERTKQRKAKAAEAAAIAEAAGHN